MASKDEKGRGLVRRLTDFARSSISHKQVVAAMYWRRFVSDGPVPIRLPFGAWWLARHSALDSSLMGGTFEPDILRFAERYLVPGMSVLDIGAHHGLYSLLAAKQVGRSGRVVAFEPSPRERKRLEENIRLNFFRNITIESFALGPEASEAKLYQVSGAEDYCNSLRPPAGKPIERNVQVKVTSLDEFLSGQTQTKFDFVKIDTEGAELGILQGAVKFLTTHPRPTLLCEVAEIRTSNWGYHAAEIVTLLRDREFEWFAVVADGSLTRLDANQDLSDANLVAIPSEAVNETLRRVNATDR